MTRARRAAAVIVVLVVAAAAPTAARSADAPRAALTSIACHGSADPDLRRVSVTAIMRHRPGTERLSVRLTLVSRAPGSAPTVVRGGDLGRWISPAVATLGRAPDDVWRLAKAVYGVPAPAAYRFRVQFRWEGAGGRVIAQERLTTGVCRVRATAGAALE